MRSVQYRANLDAGLLAAFSELAVDQGVPERLREAEIRDLPSFPKRTKRWGIRQACSARFGGLPGTRIQTYDTRRDSLRFLRYKGALGILGRTSPQITEYLFIQYRSRPHTFLRVIRRKVDFSKPGD